MKIITMTCPDCGASLQADITQKTCICQYCGSSLYFDEEIGQLNPENAEETGYQLEKGRQRAEEEAYRKEIERIAAMGHRPEEKSYSARLWVIPAVAVIVWIIYLIIS